MASPDITDENIEFIRKKWPEAVTEVEEDGKTVFRVDFDVLRQELSRDLISDKQERYQMTWPGKKKAILAPNQKTTKTLRPDESKSLNFPITKNVYIEGDNFDALNILRETYLGKIKAVYIDPPYNTGNDFVFEDAFEEEQRQYLEESNQIDAEGNRLVLNNNADGKIHSNWLNMIYPRLKIAKDFLSDDGFIFVSIDDNEVANLRIICNEIFGESNFVACFKWNRTEKAPSLSDSVRIKYEYVLCYKRDQGMKMFGKKGYNLQGPLFNPPNKVGQIVFPPHSIKVPGSFSAGHYSDKFCVDLSNDLEEKDGYNSNEVRISGKFKWSQNTVNDYLKSGKVFEIKKSPATFYYQLDPENSFLPPADIINEDECSVKRNPDASAQLSEMGIPFDFSKPVSLIKYLINSVTYDDKDALIMDFFSGSATTAQAVFELNAADNGNRRFILIQLPEPFNGVSSDGKVVFKTICDIGEERIRRASATIFGHQDSLISKEDGGFRVFYVDSSNMKDVYYNPQKTAQMKLDDDIDNVKPDRTHLDLLFQVMLNLGVDLSAKIEEFEFDGKKVYSVQDNYIVACFASDVTDEVISKVAQMRPVYAVFKDSSFQNDSANINCFQILKTANPAFQEENLKVI